MRTILIASMLVLLQATPSSAQMTFEQMTQTMEGIIPQSANRVDGSTLNTLDQVLADVQRRLTDTPVTVGSTFAAPETATVMVPQSVQQTEMVPVQGFLGRTRMQPMVVTRQVIVPMQVTQLQPAYASAQGPQIPRPSPQSVYPSPQAPSQPQTTLGRNANELGLKISELRGLLDSGKLSTSDVQSGSTSLRHLAIQVYALVLGAQELSFRGSTGDSEAGSIKGLSQP